MKPNQNNIMLYVGLLLVLALLVLVNSGCFFGKSISEEDFQAIHVGMTKDQVRKIAGKPSSTSSTEMNDRIYEKWFYESVSKTTVIDFTNGTVQSKHRFDF